MFYTFDNFNNFSLLEQCLYLESSSFSLLNVFFSLSPEIFLIFGIFIYLCFIKGFNNFYINSLFFYFILFLELILLCLNGLSLIFYNNKPEFFFYSCFIVDTYSIFCKCFFVIFLILITIFSEFKLV
jgi:hypothetical protein